MKHVASHPLPITTGFGGSSPVGGQPEYHVYCGICKGSFDIDQEWVTRKCERGIDSYFQRQFEAAGFSTKLAPPPAIQVAGSAPRPASEADFPYHDPRVAFMYVQDGEIKQITFQQARALTAQGHKTYGAWPGKWRQDIFILDDIS